MSINQHSNHRVAIVGGGISGLVAAYRLPKILGDCDVELFESSPQPGGVLQTESVDGFLIEQSGDMFTSEPDAAIRLCEEIGFSNELIKTNPIGRRAFVAQSDRLLPVPDGFSLMLPTQLDAIRKSELLSVEGKKRMLQETEVLPKDDQSDESLYSFSVRRFGIEAYERLIQPLVGGIYSADAKKLSMQATLQRFLDMEREHGSLIQAAVAKKQAAAQGDSFGSDDSQSSGARYGMFSTPRFGMKSLVDHLTQKLNPRVRITCDRLVGPLRKRGLSDGRPWLLQLPTGQSDFDGVVIATNAASAGQILTGVDPALSDLLSHLTYASMAIVVLGCHKDSLTRLPGCFGFVVPDIENRKMIACSVASQKFAGRAPDDHVLLRCFIGGAKRAAEVAKDDDYLVQTAIRELKDLAGLQQPPVFTKVYRWQNCMPQYHVGHLGWVESISSHVRQLDGIELAGNSYGGVGIPACIQSGNEAAERISMQIKHR